jgi:hypothetical protein
LRGFPVGWFAPTYKDQLEVWHEVNAVLKPVITHRDAQNYQLRLLGGGIIDFWSLQDPDSGRGRKYKRVIIDEAAKVPDLKTAYNETILATLSDYIGDVFLLSTPKGKNFFWSLWIRGWKENKRPGYMSWQMPTSSNPHISPAFIEKMREEMPEDTFRQEYLAEFLEDGAGVFRRVSTVAIAQLPDLIAPAGHYAMGVDWGYSNDYTVLAVMDAQSRMLVELDRFSEPDFYIQRSRIKAMTLRYRCQSILAESNAIGLSPIQELNRDGVPVVGFHTDNLSKRRIIDELRIGIEQAKLWLPNPKIPGQERFQVLIDELQAYEQIRLPGGQLRFSAPEGMHDDTVIALALAYEACQGAGFNPFAGRTQEVN